jgi:type I restriction enzyme R subunit
LFEGILSEQIERINRDILKEFTSEEKFKIIQKVKNILLSEYNPVKILYYMKYGVDVQVSRRKTSNIKLIDYKTVENNLYHYGHETLFKGHPVNSKPDFTLFINGIPVVIIEAKREFADYLTFKKAMGDIKEYEIRSPQLFNFVQFGVAYGDEKRYMATQPNYEGLSTKRKGWLWRNERKEEDIFNLIEPCRVTEIVGDFTYFLETPERELFKIVPRYVQYFAVKSALRRIESYVNEEGKKNEN